MQEGSGELGVASLQTGDGQALVSVSDSGIGFPGENRDRIFEAFFTTKPRGTGMGLSISRRIIESHGGRLWAIANSGRGATFQFMLPTDAH
jgi:signal transduction histidine kinase